MAAAQPTTGSSYVRLRGLPFVATEQEDFFEGYRKDLWFGPLQMLLKDDDFEQVGELSHVFLWGPVLELPTNWDIQEPGSGTWAPPRLIGTGTQNYAVKRTFAEVMTEVASHQDSLLAQLSGIFSHVNYLF